MATVQLPPAPRQVGVFKNLTAQQTETLVLREKVMSLTGDSFDIKLANGQPILKVEGKVMSISGRKKVFDMQGNHLFSIVKELLHIHATYAVEDPQGVKIMEVKSSFKRKSPFPISEKLYSDYVFSSWLQGHCYLYFKRRHR